VGRGTDTPFELLSAPYIDDVRWAAELNRAALPGVRFVPIRFTPAYSTFKNQPCGGVAILVTDRTRLRAVDVGLLLALTLYRLYPAQFELDQVNRLLQHDATITAIRAGQSLEQIKRAWAPGLQVFKQRRKPFLIYH
jgi:uncharacterized protein YbbC (DUF1343 family)